MDLACRLSDATSVDEVAAIVRAVGALTLGADRVGVWTIDAGSARAIGDDRSVALDDEAHPIAHVIRSPRAQWLQSDRAIAGASDRVRAACVLPLIADDRVIGAVAFTFANEHLLRIEERELVFEIATTVAVHAARAIERVGPRPPEVRVWPAGTQPIATVAPPSGRRIVVLGEPAEAEPFARALEELGHETVVVHNGAAAIRVASEWPADIAFVDVDCVTSDAIGVAGRLHGAHVQLVAVTSHPARVPGFTAHVLKPFELDTVVDLVASFDRN